jgi:two-component system, OmpR family, sensor histidine kinase VanS
MFNTILGVKGVKVDRDPGLSVRLKLTLSYAGLLMIAGGLLLGAVWIFLLRYVPERETVLVRGTSVFVSPSRDGLLRDFAPAAAVLGTFLLVVGVFGGWLLAGRMLAPLTRITEATRAAGTGSLSHRIRLPGRRDEFRDLADAFDTMLDRLEAHSAEEQRFAANASHELRTPLAIMQTLLDVARNDPNRETSELDDRLRAVNTRAIDLTEALLMLSRADRASFTSVPVDLSLIAEEATERLVPFAEKHGVTIEISSDTTPTIGSEALLLQLATNLVHNAIVHNRPEGGSLWITTSADTEAAVLRIENTGQSVTPLTVSRLVEPFQRGTDRLHTDDAGLGLGLAIVKSITEAHDGTLTLIPRPSGGLCVTVQLPPRTGTSRSGGEPLVMI